MISPREPVPPGALPARWGDKLGRLGRLVRKELFEILRDRRTIITLVLMPVLLYPLLSLAFQQFVLAQQHARQAPKYRLGFLSDREGELVLGYLGIVLDKERGVYRPSRKDPAHPDAPEPLLDIPSPELIEGFEKRMWDFPIDLGIRVRNLKELARVPPRDRALDLELIYLEDSAESRAALRWVESQCSLANVHILQRSLTALGVSQRRVPVQTFRVPEKNPAQQEGNFLAVLVPLILILMTITGAVYPAIDLTAGERERGTLEILVAAPVPRLGLLFAKYVTVLTVAMLTALVNIVMMTLTLLVTGLGPALFGQTGLTAGAVLAVFGLMLLFAAFFSAVLLTLTSFARSFKEAQAYLIPVMLLSLTPGMLAVKSDLSLAGPLAVVPLINIVLLARDLFLSQGQADPLLAVVVILSTLFSATAALALAARIFGAEGVLYSEQGSWSDLFRRSARSRPTGTVSGALLCLALLFPSYFLVNGLLAQWLPADPGVRVAAIALASVALFGGFSLLGAYLGRVRLVSGLQLRRGPWLAYPAAVLLGLSVWAFVAEIQVVLEGLGWTVLGADQKNSLIEQIRAYRQLPLAVLLGVFAFVVPVCEELFFRGYLLGALRAHTSRRVALIGSALLFGLFHMVFTFDRLIPSTLLGLVLGWVCWETRSVFPGIVLHACHNGLLFGAFYFEEEVRRLGWYDPGKSHLPAAWLGAAAVTAGVGALLIRLAGRAAPVSAGREASPAEAVP
jgi:ABC-2 type transport system permease protein/sodium transport system permease protein